jgi:hypothetical protein
MSTFTIPNSILIAVTLLLPLQAQTAPTTPGDFMIERVLTLAAAFAPTAPNFPAPVLAGLQNGVIEIHQRFTYTSAQHTLEQLAFVLPANSPVPFPNPGAAPVADHYTIQVDSVGLSTYPRPSINIVGHTVSNDAPTPWGDITGAGLTLTIGYTNAGSAVQFGPIIESVSPVYGLYTATGAGSLSLTPTPQQCTLGTLSGVYMFQLNGFIPSSGAWAPYQDSGSFQADGKGNVSVLDSGNNAGSVFIGRSYSMAYTVNQDCTGTMTFGPNAFDLRIARDGKGLNMIMTRPASLIAQGNAQLQ